MRASLFHLFTLASIVALTPAHGALGQSVVGPVSNFDDGTEKTSMGFGWTISTDELAGGQSTATMKVFDGGANGTPKSLEATGTVAAGLPYAWAGVMLHSFFVRPLQTLSVTPMRHTVM